MASTAYTYQTPHKKTKKTVSSKKRKAEFDQEIEAIVDAIYEVADEKYNWGWWQLASEAGLCYSTVYRLGCRTTKDPHFKTIWKLAKAVGMNLELVKRVLNSRVA